MLAYKNSLAQYRRYLAAVAERPLLQASLFLVLSLVLIIVLLVAALRPTLITIASLVGEIGQLRQIESQLGAKIDQLNTAANLYQRVAPRLGVLDQALPPTAAVGGWSQALAVLVQGYGINPVQVSLTDIAVSSSPSADIAFTLTASGEYTRLNSWLKALENLRRLTILKTAQFTSSADGDLLLVVTGALAVSDHDQKAD